jgi:hypothetical protein
MKIFFLKIISDSNFLNGFEKEEAEKKYSKEKLQSLIDEELLKIKKKKGKEHYKLTSLGVIRLDENQSDLSKYYGIEIYSRITECFLKETEEGRIVCQEKCSFLDEETLAEIADKGLFHDPKLLGKFLNKKFKYAHYTAIYPLDIEDEKWVTIVRLSE